jgi:hypothetical protein
MVPIRLVQYDVGTDRNYVSVDGRSYYGSPRHDGATRDIEAGERVTVEPLGIGMLVRSATCRETWYALEAAYIEAGNYGSADYSGE